MANFEEAIKIVLAHEGGYVKAKNDHGGATNFGISQRSYPEVDIENLTREEAEQLYRRDFWKPIYDRINSQAIANKLFDLGVNMGTQTAIKLLQTACIDCAMPVAADGKFGSVTLNAVNSLDPVLLLTAFKKRALGHYQHIVAMDATQSVFIDDWAKRAMA
jgi:lysozyme family protein